MHQLLVRSEVKNKPFWALSIPEALTALDTDMERGLSAKEAEVRLGIFGRNIIEKGRQFAKISILLGQFKSPLILILVVAGLVTIFTGHGRDALFIFLAVVVNTALGFYQESKAEKALAELKTYLKQRARVIREGVEREIEAEFLVPGDILRLAQGDRIPADARLVFVNDLQVDEAILTGESLPVAKSVNAVRLQAPISDQHSIVFAGTLITQGIGTAVVCRTDFDTELGKIAKLVATTEGEQTPLQVAIQRFSMRASFFLALLTLFIFTVGIASGYSWTDMFLISVAVAVSAIPEGLPIALTVILAMGVQRMARRKGVVRKLIAAEALGSTTVILTDKTGTLTMAKMELSQLLPSEKGEGSLLELALLNTSVLVENPKDSPEEWRMSGKVVEVALVRYAARHGLRREEAQEKMAMLSSLPFNPVNKFSASLIRMGGKRMVAFFGAADILVKHSALNPHERERMLQEIHRLAKTGELVLGVATKEIEGEEEFSFVKDLKLSHLQFTGLITFRDPVRPGVRETIQNLEAAGIRTVVVTGDHRGTAEAVAREVGIKVGHESILDAEALDALSDQELKEMVPLLRVVARITPLGKVRIAKAFQERGEVVAMTGDGVNDAPSIKQADIGVAMGSGTEVARSVADLVLLDDNFETIAAAVEEGHQIMKNIRKVIVYLFSSVTDNLFLIGGALLVGVPLPLNALQILWVNFFTDSFPAISFAFERSVDGLSSRPLSPKAGLLDPLMRSLIFFAGIFTSALLFFTYWALLRTGAEEVLVRTFIFSCFGTYSLFLAFSVRSLEKSILEYGLFSNGYLVMGTGFGMLMMLAAVYLPFLQTLFGTVSLPLYWAAGVAGVGVLNIVIVEFVKWIFRPGAPRIAAARA